MRLRLLVLVLAAGLLAVSFPAVCLARYTWSGDGVYSDCPSSQWYYAYVESMRRAKVVSGWKYGSSYHFRPNDTAQRSWLGMAYMEILGTLEDYSYRIGNTDWYWDGRRWFLPYANDMLAKGLIPYQTFQDGNLRRDEGFSWAVRAMGLREVAAMMPASEVDYWLNRFPDGWRTDPQYRADMALCIKLGIAKGYDDGTLRPDTLLPRAQGATIASRMLSVVLQASPEVFRPQDGQATVFSARTYGEGTVLSWRLEVGPAVGSWSVLRSWSGSGLPSVLASWDGRDSSGRACPPGRYLAQLTGDYRTVVGEVLKYQIVRQVVVDGRSLVGQVGASWWKRGSSVPVSVAVSGVQKSPVTVRGDWGGSIQIPPGQFSGSLPIPDWVPGGTHVVTFEAVLGQDGCPDAVFTSAAQFVVDARSFRVELDGSQYRAGSLAPFVLQVSGAVKGAVRCHSSWGEVWELGPGETSGYVMVPAWASVGEAWVEFEAVLSQAGCPDEVFRSRVDLLVLPAAQGSLEEIPAPPPAEELPDWWTPPWLRGW